MTISRFLLEVHCVPRIINSLHPIRFRGNAPHSNAIAAKVDADLYGDLDEAVYYGVEPAILSRALPETVLRTVEMLCPR
jgi:hypothetical protein